MNLTATSKQTGKIMDIFKEKMGAHNYVILNALPRKEELIVTATTQEGSAAAATGPSGVQSEE